MDLHVLSKIASYSLESYVALLAIPNYARHVRANNYRVLCNFLRKETDEKGTISHYFNDKLYFTKSKNDECKWFKNGKLHRDIFPAIVNPRYIAWYQNGQCHRNNELPAIEYVDGTKAWYQNNKHHRDNDLPAIEYANGDKHYYKHGVKYFPNNK